MERLAIFIEYANFEAGARRRGITLDAPRVLDYLVADRFLTEAFVYVPIDPRNLHGRQHLIEELWAKGFFVRSKVGTQTPDSYKCNFDVEITMEMVRIAHEVKPDTVILGSGDVDFIPVVHQLRAGGIRVEGAAFSDSAARELIMHCSGFINLDELPGGGVMDAEPPVEPAMGTPD